MMDRQGKMTRSTRQHPLQFTQNDASMEVGGPCILENRAPRPEFMVRIQFTLLMDMSTTNDEGHNPRHHFSTQFNQRMWPLHNHTPISAEDDHLIQVGKRVYIQTINVHRPHQERNYTLRQDTSHPVEPRSPTSVLPFPSQNVPRPNSMLFSQSSATGQQRTHSTKSPRSPTKN